MKENEMIMCLIAFILGYLVARMSWGNGFNVGIECGSAPSLNEWNNWTTCMENQINIPLCKGTNTFEGATNTNCTEATKQGIISGPGCGWKNGTGDAANGSWVTIGYGLGTQCIINKSGNMCKDQDDVGNPNLCKIKTPEYSS